MALSSGFSATDMPSTPGLAADPTWQELEGVLDDLSRLARAGTSPAEFYRELLESCVRTMAAEGGAAWLVEGRQQLRPLAHMGQPPKGDFTGDPDARALHEKRLLAAAAQGEVLSWTAAESGAPSRSAASQPVVIVGPVAATQAIWPTGHSTERLHGEENAGSAATIGSKSTNAALPPVAILEIAVKAGAAPATYKGLERFLAAVCEVAAEYHALRELGRLRSEEHYHRSLLQLSHAVHLPANLAATAYTVANEGRRTIGCDRLSVVSTLSRRPRLLATSGMKRVERRSRPARQLESLARLACRLREPLYYLDGETDSLPDAAEQIDRYADESHARQIAVVPLFPARPGGEAESHVPSSERLNQGRNSARRRRPHAVLIAERFDASTSAFDAARAEEVGQVCATALEGALRWNRLPLRWLWEGIGAARDHLFSGRWLRTAAVILLLAGAIAALTLVQIDFTVEAPGTLEPTVERNVFATRDGLVEELLVEHGQQVDAGAPLVLLRDPTLELDIKRVLGELQTVTEQLEAVRATRMSRALRDAPAVDGFRLSAEERELQQRQANLRQEMELLQRQQEQLTIRSPLSGRVVTWEPDQLLAARPVARGQVLLTVADLDAPWKVELDVPDGRIGDVLAAQQSFGAELPVRFRLASDEVQHTGHVESIAALADPPDPQTPGEAPAVRVTVGLEELNLDKAARRELRPGITVRARIDCGRRSAGYVWFRDMWHTLVKWTTF